MSTATMSVGRVVLGIAAVGCVILLGSVITGYAFADCDELEHCRVFNGLFHLDAESSIPAWYSSGLWGLAAVIALAISLVDDGASIGLRRQWRCVAVLFFFLSMDEAAMFHERAGALLARSAGAGDVFYYDWLFYGFAFTLLAGLLSVRFLLKLPRRTSVLLVISGAIFLTGALGIETLGAASHKGGAELLTKGWHWWVTQAAEEILEIVGVVALIYALLDHVSRMDSSLNLHFQR